MKGSAAKIQMTSLDELFGGSTTQVPTDQIQEIPLTELYSFKDHPFHVVDDEKMQEMAESVAQYGVLVPGIVRPRSEGGYEIVAGHRRKRASELAGKSTMPVIVRDMDDDEATIIMVDSNLQREKILPSEKAFAYKMKLEAMKHQGQRDDLTCARAVHKLKSRDILTQQAGEKSGISSFSSWLKNPYSAVSTSHKSPLLHSRFAERNLNCLPMPELNTHTPIAASIRLLGKHPLMYSAAWKTANSIFLEVMSFLSIPARLLPIRKRFRNLLRQ